MTKGMLGSVEVYIGGKREKDNAENVRYKTGGWSSEIIEFGVKSKMLSCGDLDQLLFLGFILWFLVQSRRPERAWKGKLRLTTREWDRKLKQSWDCMKVFCNAVIQSMYICFLDIKETTLSVLHAQCYIGYTPSKLLLPRERRYRILEWSKERGKISCSCTWRYFKKENNPFGMLKKKGRGRCIWW